MLHEVAYYEPPRALDDKGKYRLKDEMWGEFDGFFTGTRRRRLRTQCKTR